MFPPVVPAVKRHRLESSPKSRLVTAGAEMMLGGSRLLALSAATGEPSFSLSEEPHKLGTP
jgi:hypothetical protein